MQTIFNEDDELEELFWGNDKTNFNTDTTEEVSTEDNSNIVEEKDTEKEVVETINEGEDNTGTEIINPDVGEKEDNNKSDDYAMTDEELSELEELLSDTTESIEDTKDTLEEQSKDDGVDNSKLVEQLTKAVKDINKYKSKVVELELKNAEAEKFWEEATLSPSLVIINSYYEKAMDGDLEAKDKLLKLFSQELWVELRQPNDVFLSSTITGSIDWTNTGSSVDDNVNVF